MSYTRSELLNYTRMHLQCKFDQINLNLPQCEFQNVCLYNVSSQCLLINQKKKNTLNNFHIGLNGVKCYKKRPYLWNITVHFKNHWTKIKYRLDCTHVNVVLVCLFVFCCFVFFFHPMLLLNMGIEVQKLEIFGNFITNFICHVNISHRNGTLKTEQAIPFETDTPYVEDWIHNSTGGYRF